MAFEYAPMEWSGDNAAQPGSIASTGYVAGDSPAAEHENYFRYHTYMAIKELQDRLADLEAKVDYTAAIVADHTTSIGSLDARVTALEG